MKTILVFSFGLSKDEINNPCLSNIDLALATKKILESEKGQVKVVAQWEVGNILRRLGVEPNLEISDHLEGLYLDSEDVALQAYNYLKKYDIKKVIPIAQPWLHLFKCRKLIKNHGLEPVKRKFGRIRFDSDSIQWYTRGPIRLVFYAILQILFGHKGHTH